MSPQAHQAAIETKMSMPRPQAVNQWLAEQGQIEIGGPRSTGVLIAIAALATLCVMGVLSLIIFKVRQPVHAGPITIPTAASPQPAGTATADSDDGKDNPDDSKSGDGKGDDKGAKAAEPADTSADSSKTTTASTKPDGPPGRLTVTCTPNCDQVVANGRALGPSPIINHELPSGQYRVTLKRNGVSDKTVAVMVVGGQLTTQRVSMR
jgi:hypothetical protein